MKWKFDCFKDNRGESEVVDFIKSLSVKAKQNLKRALQILSVLPIQDWHKPNPSSNISNHIYVIRFKDENRTQWRIYGFHDVQRGFFMMTNYGTEKDGKYKPAVSKCAELSTERMQLCSGNDRASHVYGSGVSNEFSITTDQKLLG
ncbi:MAG: hypothetical protein PHC99_12585 [Methylococcales bacterium]|nr:hypothetical protein [Methylococcales bacterium]